MTEPPSSHYWRDFAHCTGMTADLYYPDREDYATIREAKQICKGCPVSSDCLTAAFKSGEPDGIWGGYTPEEREIIRISNRYPLNTPVEIHPHGTAAGYKRHNRDGTPACQACLRAHNVARNDNRASHARKRRDNDR